MFLKKPITKKNMTIRMLIFKPNIIDLATHFNDL